MRIAYVGHFEYGISNAAGLRVRGVASALALAGNEVLIGSNDPRRGTERCAWPGPGAVAAHGLAPSESPAASGAARLMAQWHRGRIAASWIEQLLQKPDLVILYGNHFGYLFRLLLLGRRIGVPIVVDVTEWHGLSEIPPGRTGPVIAIGYEVSMRVLIPRADGVIVVSRFLEEYYGRHGCRTLRIPPLIEVGEDRPLQFRDDYNGLHLCYAGTPGGKDELATILKAVSRTSHESRPVTLHVVGFDREALNEYCRRCEISLGRESEPRIVTYGRVDNDMARKIVASCDFTVLLRRDTLRSRAGFPSKIAESLTLGTPVIANLTSDLGSVLNAGNSVVVNGITVDALTSALRVASEIPRAKLSQMKVETRAAGRANFAPLSKASAIHEFVHDLCRTLPRQMSV